ncbi:esterase-like activity of phytase-domain-containing protein [Flammula alnicola]|nr:esterase-like activity of phytase-domain-containing protein [Flammula alnicola]
MFSRRLSVWLLLVLALKNIQASPVQNSVRADANFTTAVVDGVTYTNKGLVGFGLIPSNFKDSTGDTLGGFGSAMTLKRGTFKEKRGTSSGTLLARPDRGFNVNGTIDYQARQHEIDFVLTPYYGTNNLTFQDAQQTLQLTYRDTVLQFDRLDKKTSGLDPTSVRDAQPGFQSIPFLDPVMPIVAKVDNRLVLDVEGLVANRDGTFWISDEYGPYIYRFSAQGHLIQTIQPQRRFEGLTFDESTQTLYAMLQSATIQDGGASKSTSRFTRLFAYDVGNPALKPRLVGEWVVPLPQSSKGNTEACSEIHFVSPGLFLALSRDGDGHGGGDDKSSYKQADLFSIAHATDIHNTKFDDPANSNSIAVAGVLDSSITPAEYVSFVNYIDPVQLARFGLHNGKPADPTLIDGKWESLALAPVNDPAFPHDYFLFTATQGVALGVPFNAGIDVDNQVLVFRVALPSVINGSVEHSIGI